MAPSIYTFGETVYDIIFRGGDPVAARPGGSMLNAAVSLGRLGTPVSFISEVSDDPAGHLITDFLKENGVQTSYITHYQAGRTALALAFLDENKEASYTFYKDYPEVRNLILPEPAADDHVLFGSFFAITAEMRKPVVEFLKTCQKKNTTIVYDPNFRKPHLGELEQAKPWIIENISLSDLVRGSEEDFRLIFGWNTAEEAYSAIRDFGCDHVVYTRSGGKVSLMTPGSSLEVKPPEVSVQSTIGAGDSFNAGLVYGMFINGITKANIKGTPREKWKEITEMAAGFGSHVCSGYDNYISVRFARKIRNLT